MYGSQSMIRSYRTTTTATKWRTRRAHAKFTWSRHYLW